MSALAIQKGIPLPENPPQRGRPASHDWSLMEVGDSVLVPSGRIARRAYEWGRVNGRKFTIRKERYGHRVWRLS